MTNDASLKQEGSLTALTIRVGAKDLALLKKVASEIALPGEGENLSRAARVLFQRARKAMR